MLRLTLAHAGHKSKIELNGEDVSRFFRSVKVETSVNDATRATLEYSGAVVVEADGGQLELAQAAHYVLCGDCDKTLAGDPQPLKVIEINAFSVGNSRRYAVVPDATPEPVHE